MDWSELVEDKTAHLAHEDALDLIGRLLRYDHAVATLLFVVTFVRDHAMDDFPRLLLSELTCFVCCTVTPHMQGSNGP